MRVTKTQSGGPFGAASGQVVPNHRQVKIEGIGTANGNRTNGQSQGAALHKPLAAASETVSSGNMNLLLRTGGIANKPPPQTEEQVRDIIEATEGPEFVRQRSGGSFTFVFDATSEEAGSRGGKAKM